MMGNPIKRCRPPLRDNRHRCKAIDLAIVHPIARPPVTNGGMGLQLELPLEDDELSGVEGDVFTSENHLFDFSTVNILPLEEYRRIAEDSDICPPSMKLANKPGYQLRGE